VRDCHSFVTWRRNAGVRPEGKERDAVTSIEIFRKVSEVKTVPAGEVIFRQEDDPDVMYGVLDGELEIRVGDRLIDIVGPGGIVGELALIDHKPRSATVKAVTEARLVPIDQRRFLFLVQETPFFAINVMRIMAERIRRLLAVTETAAD
jgi:CRP/FNR family transcriptional regulator, cyclic AMP receptor protein